MPPRSLFFLLFSLSYGLQIILEQRTPLLTLAAYNLRRYLHQLDVRYAPLQILSPSLAAVSPTLHISISPSCPPSLPFTITALNASYVRLSACDASGQGAFYAVQDLLHALGVYFTAEGPPFLPPSARLHAELAWNDAPLTPLSAQFSQRILAEAAALKPAAPAFQYRGFQPWGSYPIGNDWWDFDEYRRVVEVIVSLKGNWIGMHNYPCSYAYPEPGVWLSSTGNQSSNLLPSGNLTPPAAASSPLCKASWASTERGSWGLFPLPTSSLKFGAAALFERDCFGNRALTQGPTGVCPLPVDAASSAEAYNRIGTLYKSVFAFAAQMGVSTALGAEFPLPSSYPPSPPPPSPPPSPPPQQPLPLRIFWSVGRKDTFVTPTACAECPPPGSPQAYVEEVPPSNSTVLVLPTPGPGLLPLDSYWWNAGTDAWLGVVSVQKPPSEAYAFVRTEGYVYAAAEAGDGRVPLLQYARANYSKPGGLDTWLVVGTEGGVAAAVTLGYGPLNAGDAPVGWASLGAAPTPTPTPSPPAPPPPPPPSALSLAIYTDAFTRLQCLYGPNLTWYWAWTEESVQWSKISQSSALMKAAVSELGVMGEAAKAAGAQFGIALGGWMLGAYDNRTLFDAHAPPDWPLASLDGYLGESPPDDAFGAMPARAQRWSHPWVEDDMDLTAVQQWVGRNLAHAAKALEVGVTGHASLQWRTRTVAPALTAVARFPFNTTLTAPDFLMDYAGAAFGGGAPAAALGALMIQVDSAAMPRPVKCDPGCMAPDASMCSSEAGKAYEFVGLWEAQRGGVEAGGDPSALARFDYASAHFTQLSAMRAFQCSWGQYLQVLKGIQTLPSGSSAQKAAAVSVGFPAFANLVGNASALMWTVQEGAGSYGDLGVLMQMYGDVEKGAGEGVLGVLETLAGGAQCGSACHFPEDFSSSSGSGNKPPSVRVFTVRTVLQRGEPFNLRAHVLGGPGCAWPSGVCAVHVALLGSTVYEVNPLEGEGAGRAVFAATVPLPQGGEEGGIQWYVNCTCGGATPSLFPPSAPLLPQTVVFI